MYRRILDLRPLVRHRSLFLFGPRQTGKSTLVRRTFPDAAIYDLLEADYLSAAQHPPGALAADAGSIEVKAKSRVSARDYKGLLALAEEVRLERKLVVCHEPRARRDDHGVEILPVQRFLGALWDGALIG